MIWPTSSKPGQGKIGRITTSGDIAEFAVNGGVYGITMGPDQAMWFTRQGANSIGRISLKGEITEFPIPTDCCEPELITLGPDNALWFTEYHSNAIGRLQLV
jgi:virginiamycin B lyase